MEKMKPNGAAAAGILAAAVGVAVIGIAVVAATASAGIKDALNWWAPGGPLVGKTGVGVIAWLCCWPVLHFLWRDRDVQFSTVAKISTVLFVVAFAGTFPPIFDAFAPH